MGAEYLSEHYSSLNKKQIVEEYNKLVEDADDVGYSGDWGETTGLQFVDTICDSVLEAEEVAGVAAKKWGPAVAVAYKPRILDINALGPLVAEYNMLVDKKTSLKDSPDVVTVTFEEEQKEQKKGKQLKRNRPGVERTYYHCVYCDILYPTERKIDICPRCRKHLGSQQREIESRLEELKQKSFDLGAERQRSDWQEFTGKLQMPEVTFIEGGWVLAAVVSS